MSQDVFGRHTQCLQSGRSRIVIFGACLNPRENDIEFERPYFEALASAVRDGESRFPEDQALLGFLRSIRRPFESLVKA